MLTIMAVVSRSLGQYIVQSNMESSNMKHNNMESSIMESSNMKHNSME